MLQTRFQELNLVFAIPEPKDYERVTQAFCNYMIVDEPGTKSRGGYPNGVPQTIQDSIMSILSDGISLMAVDSENNDYICGILINQLIKRETELEMPIPTLEELTKQYPLTHAMLLKICNDAFPGRDFFQEFPGCVKLVDMYALGVDPKYRTRGIARSLVKHAFQIAEKNGCDGAIITPTNRYTGLIASKLNMKLYKSVAWRDYKDQDGKKWFPSQELESQYVDLYFKIF